MGFGVRLDLTGSLWLNPNPFQPRKFEHASLEIETELRLSMLGEFGVIRSYRW